MGNLGLSGGHGSCQANREPLTFEISLEPNRQKRFACCGRMTITSFKVNIGGKIGFFNSNSRIGLKPNIDRLLDNSTLWNRHNF